VKGGTCAMGGGAMASLSVACSMQVAAGTQAPGTADLTATHLVWRPDAAGLAGEKAVLLTAISGHQRNKPGAPKASLRLVLGAPPPADAAAAGAAKPAGKPAAMVLQFAVEADRDVLSDQIKARLSEIERAKKAAGNGNGNGGGGGGAAGAATAVSGPELAARAALLQSNAELHELHAR